MSHIDTKRPSRSVKEFTLGALQIASGIVAAVSVFVIVAVGLSIHLHKIGETYLDESDVAVYYDSDRNIVKVRPGPTVHVMPWETMEIYDNWIPGYGQEEAPRLQGTLPTDRGVYSASTIVTIEMTREDAIRYLNGRSEEAKMAEVPSGYHPESLESYAKSVAFQQLKKEADSSDSTLPEIEWQQDGATEVREDPTAFALLMDPDQRHKYSFDHFCKITPLVMADYKNTDKAYRNFFSEKGETFTIELSRYSELREWTEIPCGALSLEGVLPPDFFDDAPADDGSTKLALAKQ